MITSIKTCFKCGAEKPLSEFYKHNGMEDGHLGKCKECTRQDVQANRKARLEKYREYDRNRGSRQPYQHTVEYRERYPDKYSAHTALGNAVRDKRIIKPEVCESCGSAGQRLHGHHDDYLKPLVVRWLCPPCHSGWHVKNGEAINAK